MASAGRVWTRSWLTAVAAVVTALLAAAGAIAYFTSLGAGSSTATVGTLPAPAIASVTPGSGTVAISWAPGITPPGAGATTYYIQRDGATAAGCPTSASPTGVTSCTDTDPPPGDHTYTVTAVWRSWTSTSGSSSGTPLSAPAILSATPSARGQGATNQSIAISGTGFVAGAVVTFSGSGITVNSTTFSSATSLTANITIATGASTGSRIITVTNPDTGAGTGVGLFTVTTGPSVTAGTPSSRPQGAVDQDIAITGSGFASGALASFSGSGITVNSTTFDSATQLTANITIAAGATAGARDITVANPDGGTGVGSSLFTVNASLTVSSASPALRNQGATNQNIQVTGTNFASGAVVAFSGAGITVNSTTLDSPTQITANISIDVGAPTGARNVTVTNLDGGTDTGIGIFVIDPAPTLTSAAPASRGRGASNQDITLTGTGFISGSALAASFGSEITVNSTTFVSSTTLTANVTVGATAATGARTVTVTNGDGSTAAANVFTVTPAPTMTSATPAARGQGAMAQNITIIGTDFVSGAAVSFSGTGITVNSTTFNTATSLTANITVAEGATTGLRDVTVTNPDAGLGTRTGGFTVNTGPTVTSATPGNRGQGATNQNIVILGTSFATGAVASFSGSGITVNSTTLNSATQVTANITIAADATAGARDVFVTNTDAGRGTATGIFSVMAAPTVSSAAPNNRGRGVTNQTIVITGTNFVSGATVSFSGTRITVNSTTVNSPTELTANVSIAGNAATGLRNIIVNNNNGGVPGTCTGCFTVNPRLTITAATPSSRGRGAANQDITLIGTGFRSGATVTSFSGTGITVNSTTFNSSTALTVNISISPTAAIGSRRITVNGNDGSPRVLSRNIFTVAAAPTLTSVTPSSQGQGAVSQNITIVGSGFVSGAAASFSGTGITVNSTTFNSAASLTANITIAADATAGARDVNVTNPNAGVGSRVNGLTVTAVSAPTVTSTSPASAPRKAVNQSVTVTGTGFVAGAIVSFSGGGITVNSTTFSSATQVTVNITIAAGAARGPRDVTVANPDGGRGTGSGVFTVT